MQMYATMNSTAYFFDDGDANKTALLRCCKMIVANT